MNNDIGNNIENINNLANELSVNLYQLLINDNFLDASFIININ